jgi:hypothetical protein
MGIVYPSVARSGLLGLNAYVGALMRWSENDVGVGGK